jgi:peptide/nickel transport system substrate-binding protein
MTSTTRLTKRKRTFVALATATTAISLTACGGSDGGSSDEVDLSKQTWLVPQDWGGIDPLKVTSTNTGSIQLVLEPLVTSNAEGGVSANLAQQATPDPTTFVYDLRPEATFADGKAVTTDDVLYSFSIHTAKDSTSTLAGKLASVTTVEATGEHQVTVKLSEPDVQFENTVARMGIVEKAVREKLGDGAGAPDKLNVGSGPYTVKSFKPGSQLVLQRNEKYWGEKPEAKVLTMKLIDDDSARLLAVQSGDVTGAFEIPAAQADTYGRAQGMKVISGPNPSVMLFNVNTLKKPWNDVHVRRAVASAIDKKGIINAVLKGRGKPAVSIVRADAAADVMSADAAKSLYAKLDSHPMDLSAAKSEMAQSATPEGFDETVIYSEAEASSGLVAQAVAANLKPLGINLTVKSVPDAQYTDAVFFNHTASAAIVDFTTDSPDPISLVNYLTSGKQTLAAGGYTNIAEYQNADQDKILEQYLSTPSVDESERGKLLTSALENVDANAPYIPIYNAEYLAVVKKGITFEDFDGMWWMRRWVDDVNSK